MQHEHEHEGRLARMIPARKSPLIEAWFRGYVRRYLRRSFHRVLLLGEPPAMPDGPLLVCMNHSSWWDPLLVFWLSRELLSWDAYGPMDQRQLNRYPILARIGAFGVDRESLQAAREFVRYSDELLRGRRRALWLTAQGAMVSSAARPVRFYSGVASLVQSLGVAHVTTVVLEYEFWDEKRPEAFVSFATAIPVVAGPGFVRKPFLRELEARMERQMDELAEARRERNASLFRVLLSGETGISPVYDRFRQTCARRARSTHAPEHGAVRTPPRWGPGRHA